MKLPPELVDMILSHLDPWDYERWRISSKLHRNYTHTVNFKVYQKCLEQAIIRNAIDQDYSFHIRESGISHISFQYLLETQNHKELLWALKYHHKITDKLLQDIFSEIASRWFGSLGNEILEVLYLTQRIPPTFNNGLPLFVFCRQGNIDIVGKLISITNERNPRILGCFSEATRRGFHQITELLLKSNLIESNLLEKQVIWDCFHPKNIQIGTQLLQQKDFDPGKAELLQIAVCYNNIELVRLMLNDPRIDSTTQGQAALRQACQLGYVEILEILLGKIAPVNDSSLIQISSQHGHTRIVAFLLQDPRIDPASEKNQALQTAVSMNRLNIVQLLLQDPRVDPSDRDNLAYHIAKSNNNLEILSLLVQDPRVAILVNG